jgi:hypothetical protein
LVGEVEVAIHFTQMSAVFVKIHLSVLATPHELILYPGFQKLKHLTVLVECMENEHTPNFEVSQF